MISVNSILKSASKITSLPIVKMVSVAANHAPDLVEIEGYLKAQRLARQAAVEIAAMLQPGWSEAYTAEMLNTWLLDHRVESFFHKAFVWFGERTRFDGVRNYYDYLPGKRVLRENETYILDVAPIVGGYICDIGFSNCFGSDPEFETCRSYLAELRSAIPELFQTLSTGSGIWNAIDENILSNSFENIHKKYPFSVLGHRIHKSRLQGIKANLINFGWQSYWELLSRGLFGQLLNQNFEGDLKGLWAIEPHIGTPTFGAKFEEILLVDENGCRWIEDDGIGLLSTPHIL